MAKRVVGGEQAAQLQRCRPAEGERHPRYPSQCLFPGASLEPGLGFLLLAGILQGSVRKLWVPPGHLGPLSAL